MKRIVIFTLIIGLSLGVVFAGEEAFRPISTRLEAMGGAGLTLSHGSDAFYYNPANLAGGKLRLNLPSVTATVFNPKAILDSNIPEIIETGGDEMPQNLLVEYLDKAVLAGKGDMLAADVGISFTGGGFGLGLNVQQRIRTTSTDGSLLNDKLIADLNVSIPVGLGVRINVVPKYLAIDVGVGARFVYRAYSEKIGLSKVLSFFDDTIVDPLETFLGGTTLATSWAIPIDVGVNINGPMGLRLSAVARNLNGVYNVTEYAELGTWLNEMTAHIGMEPIYGGAETAPDDTSGGYTVPWSLDVGFGWMPNLGILKPAIGIDLADVIAVAKQETSIWDNLTAGVEVQLLSMLSARGGFNKGYWSLGVGLDLFIFHIDAAYYVREYGQVIGDKPVDALSVRVNIGFDR